MERQLSARAESLQASQRQFLKYTFFKVDPVWRRLDKDEIASSKLQFGSIVKSYAANHTLKTYSLVGIRGDADFMFWTTSERLEEFQEFTSRLLSSKLGRYLTIPYSYLAMTKQSEYLGGHRHEGQEGATLRRSPGDSKYLFVYPFTKKREWYSLPRDERKRMMQEHFKIGHKYPSVKINTGYSFGLDDQEFMLSFETDSPADFSDLVTELRTSEASRYTALETPIFTCIATDIEQLLDLLAN